MSLSEIADKLDSLVNDPQEESEEEGGEGTTLVAEDAHAAIAQVLSYALGEGVTDADMLAEALISAAVMIESDNELQTGDMSITTLQFLESITDAYRAKLMERVGGDADGQPNMDPVEHAAYYYAAHGMFPPGAPRDVVVGAMKKIASLPKQ